jgi:predicted TIM-barrel fold metal-dependent hydrolase
MTQLGTDTQVLHNTIFIEQITERPDVEVALTRSWNRWLADIWREGGGRLRWTCVVPTLSLEAAQEEIRFAKQHGAVGVCLPPFDRNLMILDQYYYPVFSLAEELDLPIIIHVANNDPVLMHSLRTRAGLLDGFACFRIPIVIACYGLLNSDVLASFPRLRWGFVEASAQWVPWVLNESSRRHAVQYSAERNPFVEHEIYVTTQIGDDLEYIVRAIGDDRLVIGTDYGHTDPASEVDAITQFEDLDIEQKLQEKVLCLNPRRLYGMSPLFDSRS